MEDKEELIKTLSDNYPRLLNHIHSIQHLYSDKGDNEINDIIDTYLFNLSNELKDRGSITPIRAIRLFAKAVSYKYNEYIDSELDNYYVLKITTSMRCLIIKGCSVTKCDRHTIIFDGYGQMIAINRGIEFCYKDAYPCIMINQSMSKIREEGIK